MTIHRLFLLLLFFIIHLSTFSVAQEIDNAITSELSNKVLSRAEMQVDLDKLKKQVMYVHPGLEVYESSRQVPALFDSLSRQLPEQLSSIDFLLSLAPIVDAIKCGHTGFNLPTHRAFFGYIQKDLEGLFPLQLELVHGQVFIKHNLSEDTTHIRDKMQLLSVNGEAIDDVLLHLSNINIASDGDNRLGEIHFSVKYFMLAYHMFYGARKTFTVELRNILTGEEGQHQIAAGRLKAMRSIRKKRYPPAGKAPIQMRRIEGMPQAAVLDINTFSNTKLDFWELRYRQDIKKIFKIIEDEDIQYLIVDLRDNYGGAVINVVRLLKYFYDAPFALTDEISINKNFFKSNARIPLKILMGLKRKREEHNRYILKGKSGKYFRPRKRHRYRGKVIVLINEGSFSAACTLAGHTKSTGRAILLGEEAGGSYHMASAGF
ncbi:MAG TPA: hypothetical protein ENJ45_03185, partial [Phaeodactylibacter sp.]|nr:hypothetical protein [Phaeodactylibacter sp.]